MGLSSGSGAAPTPDKPSQPGSQAGHPPQGAGWLLLSFTCGRLPNLTPGRQLGGEQIPGASQGHYALGDPEHMCKVLFRELLLVRWTVDAIKVPVH